MDRPRRMAETSDYKLFIERWRRQHQFGINPDPPLIDLAIFYDRGHRDGEIIEIFEKFCLRQVEDHWLRPRDGLANVGVLPYPDNPFVRFARAFLTENRTPDLRLLAELADDGHFVPTLTLVQIGIIVLECRMKRDMAGHLVLALYSMAPYLDHATRYHPQSNVADWTLPPEDRMTTYAELLAQRGRGDGYYYLSLLRNKEGRVAEEIDLLERSAPLGCEEAHWALYWIHSRDPTPGDRRRLIHLLKCVTSRQPLPRLHQSAQYKIHDTLVENIDTIVGHLARCDDMETELRTLRAENEELRTELSYRPGGDGYASAEESFQKTVMTGMRTTDPKN